MSSQVDPLAAYYDEESENTPSNDPLAGLYEDEESQPNYRNVVDEELASKGFEPDITEEFERMYELGDSESAKGLISGATLGLTKLIPGLKPGDNVAAIGGELIGSALPIHLLGSAISAPLVNMALKSPILKNQLSAFASLAATGLTGAAVGGLEEATKEGTLKLPSPDDLLDHGIMWAAIHAGLGILGKTFEFGNSLYKAMRGTGKSETAILKELTTRVGNISQGDERIAQKAIDVLEEMAQQKSIKEIKLPEKEITKLEKVAKEEFDKQLKARSTEFKFQEVSPQEFDKLENLPGEPYFPNEFEAEKIVETETNAEVKKAIDDFAPRAATEKALGENIIKDIENTNIKAKESYDELYAQAKENVPNKYPNVQNTANTILKEIARIDAHDIKTLPEGYKKVRAQLLTMLEDLGYQITHDTNGKVGGAVQETKINLAKAIELKKRGNQLINFDLKESGAQDFLERSISSLARDVVEGFGKEGTAGRKAFVKAETLFGENAEKMNRKIVRAARFSEKPESLARQIRTPSGLADIKQVASPQQIAQIERELLEHMNNLGEDKARQFYREMRPQLSRDAQNVAEQIIESKVPRATPGKKDLQRQKLQEMVIDDLSRSSLTGERPEKALSLWKTEEGQKIIKASLEKNPNKEKIVKYLSDQSLKDFSSSVINNEGKIDFKKLNGFLKDKAAIENIRLTAGEDGVEFLKQLEQLSNRFQKNFKLIENKIDLGSFKSRKEINNALVEKGKRKLSQTKAKNQIPKKSESVANEIISPKNAKGRRELQELAEFRGKNRLNKINEERNKNDLLRRFEDHIKSYGTSTKTILGMLGIYNIGAIPAGGLIVSYNIFKKMLKNKYIRTAIRKASSSKAEKPIVLLNSIDKINDEMSD